MTSPASARSAAEPDGRLARQSDSREPNAPLVRRPHVGHDAALIERAHVDVLNHLLDLREGIGAEDGLPQNGHRILKGECGNTAPEPQANPGRMLTKLAGRDLEAQPEPVQLGRSVVGHV